MRLACLIRCLACALALIPCCAGCLTLEGHRPVSVLVRDADTKQPLTRAQAAISYPLAGEILGPGGSSAWTGSTGVAQLSATPHCEAEALLEVNAEGYVPEHRFIKVEEVRAIKRAGLFEALERRTATFVVEMYADKPLPTIDMVLPAGFHGPVQLDLQIPEEAADQPGQRQFSYTVPPSGQLCLTGPAVLRRFPVPNVTARFAEGDLLKRNGEMEEWEVAFWPVKFESRRLIFFVGNKTEVARYLADHPEGSATVVRSAETSSRGGGHGRGRRTPAQTDPGP